MLIHAFDPTDSMVCHNLSIKPTIMSPSCLALVDQGVHAIHTRVEDLSLDAVREGQFRSALTPRARVFMLGFMLSRRMTITDGYGSQLRFGDRDRFIRIYDVELQMEEVRRRVAPAAPSRLGCIWVAEEGDASREMLRVMFGTARHIVSVNIVHSINSLKADASLYDRFAETGDLVAAKLYWQGYELDGRWETLLDGAINVTKDDELQVLLQDCRDAGHCLPSPA
ncbi:hypothetical protein SJI00_05915 [Pseudomonas sp. RP23018S]|uniref:hypothetical protein n=1 Tax=Pseudomonas sp. RP23018S TaxID=3096037 RepID=UPI002ACA6F50|nr:hypothetical protein [Pseudomonas sp. RP23018S]MDZ5602301.1 hypothetical protein [Pseudomonas sp. RP23018S]